MFDLEDGLTIESYRIPWLIWIQILIFFLLLFLFYCFSVLTSDPSPTNISSSSSLASASPSNSHASSSLNKAILKKHANTTTFTNRLQHNQVGGSQSIKGEIATSTSRAIISEEIVERESCSTNSIIYFHPCNYIRLAKLAFLKCLGFDPASENSSTSDRNKER